MNEKNVHRLITLSLSDYYKTPCFPLQVGTHSFKGISLLWEILKEMGIPDHPTCLLRNLYAGQEATELDMDQRILVQNWERSLSMLYTVTQLI